MATQTLERGVIVQSGMGGFLNPPTHPEHNQSVEIDLRRPKYDRGGMSLEAAVKCEWLHPDTRRAAKAVLLAWHRPALESPEVQVWILQVLGYFRNCYRGEGPEPQCWETGKMYYMKPGDDARPNDQHAGVHFIRQYYQEFEPTGEHFEKARWGK